MSNEHQDPQALIDAMPNGDTKTLGNLMMSMKLTIETGIQTVRNEIAQSARQNELQILEVKNEIEAELTNRSCNDFWSRHDEYEVRKQMLFFDEPKSTGSADRDMEVLRKVAKTRIDELMGKFKDDIGFKDFWMEFVVRYHQVGRPARRANKSGEFDTIKVFFTNSQIVDDLASAGRRNKIDGWRVNQTITESKMFKLAKTTVDKLNQDTSHNANYKVKNYRPVFKEYKPGVPDHRKKYEQAPTNFMPDPLCFMPSQRKATHVGIRASIPDVSNNFHPGQIPQATPRFSGQFSNPTTSNMVRHQFAHPPPGSIRVTGSSGHGGYVGQMNAAEMQMHRNMDGSVMYINSQPPQPPPQQVPQQVPQQQQQFSQPQPFYNQPGLHNPTTSAMATSMMASTSAAGPSYQYSNYSINKDTPITNSSPNELSLQNLKLPPNCSLNERNELIINFKVSRKISKKIRRLRNFGKRKKRRKKKSYSKTNMGDVFYFADSEDEQTMPEETETENENTNNDVNPPVRKRKDRALLDSSAEKQPAKKASIMSSSEDDHSGSDDGDTDEFEDNLIQFFREHAKYDSNKRQWKVIGIDEDSSVYAPQVQQEIFNKIDELAKIKDVTTEYSARRNKNLSAQITSDVKLLAFLERGQYIVKNTTEIVLPEMTESVVNEITRRYQKLHGVDELKVKLHDIFTMKKNPPHFEMIISKKSVKIAKSLQPLKKKKE